MLVVDGTACGEVGDGERLLARGCGAGGGEEESSGEAKCAGEERKIGE